MSYICVVCDHRQVWEEVGRHADIPVAMESGPSFVTSSWTRPTTESSSSSSRTDRLEARIDPVALDPITSNSSRFNFSPDVRCYTITNHSMCSPPQKSSSAASSHDDNRDIHRWWYPSSRGLPTIEQRPQQQPCQAVQEPLQVRAAIGSPYVQPLVQVQAPPHPGSLVLQDHPQAPHSDPQTGRRRRAQQTPGPAICRQRRAERGHVILDSSADQRQSSSTSSARKRRGAGTLEPAEDPGGRL